MKLCEVYTSVQGEGPNTGEPTTFVRFGGCNLRCPGWGTYVQLEDGSLEQVGLPKDKYVGDLPIFEGCDTVFAVYPEWRDTWSSLTPREVADRVSDFPKRVCITGGEPLIQPREQMEQLINILRQRRHLFDLFTNGSRLLPRWATWPHTTVIMDYKLPGSKEYGTFNENNWELLTNKDAIKFVLKDENDYEVAMDVLNHAQPTCQIFLGPVWGVDPDWVAEKVVQTPKAMLNIQLHKYLWHPEERAR